MFHKSARFYDLIYNWKNYKAESQMLIRIIHENLTSGGKNLLDIACGTGQHIQNLKEHFTAEGLDLDPELVSIARERNPGLVFHQEDMTDFELQKKFDVITCLFSSIGYVKTLENLYRTISCMRQHLVPGGILIIEPWFTPGDWHPNTVHGLFIDEPDIKIARINTSMVDGRISILDLHYLIGTPEGTEHLVERHELGLFERDETLEAFKSAGLEATFNEEGLMGRGLFIGRLPND
jgi:SAM-dependent methyltransferase